MRRSMFLVLTFAALFVLQVSNALAFHDQGVAYCSGCHTMHNTNGNGALIDPTGQGYPFLLKYSNATDLCLSCHATSRGAVWGSDPMAPPAERGPGNFAFLLEDNINDGHNGAMSPIPGWRAGHTVISPSRGTVVDGLNPVAPGGTYQASALGCTSCHDPHGNEHYRLLYGAGDHVVAGNFNFTQAAPVAEGLPFSGTGSAETENNHVAYKSGMSGWCSNCHGNFHNNQDQYRHPSGVTMSSVIQSIYDTYNGTVDQNGGTHATAYLTYTPFEDPEMTIDWTAGPDGNSKVSCITCHRAHATSGQNAGRWDFNIPLYEEDGVESGSYAMPQPGNYGNDNQRSLCNKCHNKDVNDHMPF
jgi:ferredoxin